MGAVVLKAMVANKAFAQPAQYFLFPESESII